MSERMPISKEEQESFIKNHPFFCLLSDDDAQKLTQLMQEEHKNPQEVIVEEGDLVDKIYFIIDGRAEVTRDVSIVDRKERMHIAFLDKGKVIGLAQTGLFSTTGIRTAQVIALTHVDLLSVELSKLHSLLSNYPAIKETAEKFILMNRAREMLALQHLTNEDIRQMVKTIEKIKIQANTKIFSQGDSAENGYLLLTGMVNLITDNQRQETIKQDTLFGEESFAENGRYLATAIANTDCELFRLPRSIILTFKQPKQSFFDRFKELF